MSSLFGSGHMGNRCPRCRGYLLFLRQELEGLVLREYYECENCEAQFMLLYAVRGWREIKPPKKVGLAML